MIVYNKTTMFLLVKTPPLRGDRLAMTAAVGCVQIQFIALKLTAKPFSPTVTV